MNGNDTPAPLDAEQIAELREDFDHFDRNKDGLMELGEFVHFLQELEAGMVESECRLGFAEIDTDHDGTIQFQEFIDWWGTP